MKFFGIVLCMVMIMPVCLFSQILEVEGKAKITVMDDDITTDSIVVLRPGGELARRHIASLPDKTGGWTEDVDTTWTMKRVGIGTTSPPAILSLDGAYSDPLIPGATSNGILRIGPQFNDALDIGKKTGGTFDAWLQAGFQGTFSDPISLQPLGGNVGIGILSPSEKLHVNGNVKVSGIISGVSDPVNAQDAVTKSYIEQILLDFALATIVDTLKTVQGLLDAGIIPSDILNEGIDSSYFIGLNYAGGLIFYLKNDGTGLVSAPVDQSTGTGWGCNGSDLPNVINVTTSPPTGLGAEIGDGSTNTSNILIDCASAPAALACTQYIGGGFSDWFLPSAGELNEMYLKIGPGAASPNTNIGGFVVDFYWSSSEIDFSDAWLQDFFNGVQYSVDKSYFGPVRAVRAF